MNLFSAADILLPKNAAPETWAVIACDQFTSDPDYWEYVRKLTVNVPSTFHLILPEAELGTPKEAAHSHQIADKMKQYLSDGIFTLYPNSYIYVERRLKSGAIRKGLVGMVDLEAYDFSDDTTSPIRATEHTVVSRIPPRQRVRREASIELPHILMVCDDHDRVLIEPVGAKKDQFQKLYDFDLMIGGGHITGWLVSEEAAKAFDRILEEYSANVGHKYEDLHRAPMVFAVGDGNHSLATAKSCYEELKAKHPDMDLSHHPARFALVELVNIHDESLIFEPIHRFVCKTNPEHLLAALEKACCAEDGYPIHWYIGKKSGTVYLDRQKGELPIGILQGFLDIYLQENAGVEDYIHDDDAIIRLAKQENSIGFLLPTMEKSQLFRGVIADGVLPRKTFSMGSSRDKRYYLEARVIQK